MYDNYPNNWAIISVDDYWKKEFLGDNTAMLLTDVSRDVKNIKEYLEENLKNGAVHSGNSLDETDENSEAVKQGDSQWVESRDVDPIIEVSGSVLRISLQSFISFAYARKNLQHVLRR